MPFYHRFTRWIRERQEEPDSGLTWTGFIAVCIVFGICGAAFDSGPNTSYIWFLLSALIYALGGFLLFGFIAILAGAPKSRAVRLVVLVAIAVIFSAVAYGRMQGSPAYDEETQAAIEEAYEQGRSDAREEFRQEYGIDP